MSFLFAFDLPQSFFSLAMRAATIDPPVVSSCHKALEPFCVRSLNVRQPVEDPVPRSAKRNNPDCLDCTAYDCSAGLPMHRSVCNSCNKIYYSIEHLRGHR